jgi:mannose-6-phosphate isomerase
MVIKGHLAGRTLHDLVVDFPDDLVGRGWRGPHFPLLLKFLDASHRLPVHLHADDETARRVYAEPNGKTEAWHVLWAEPGATILAGVKPGLTRAELFQAFKDQVYDRVMSRYSIQPGDTVYVPGGVIHTFGPGTLIVEVQQTSDLGQSVMPDDGNGGSGEGRGCGVQCDNGYLSRLRANALSNKSWLDRSRQSARPVWRVRQALYRAAQMAWI